MKILKNLPAFLLALIYLIIPLDHFFHYMPKPPELPQDVTTYFELMNRTGYMTIVKILEIICAILLLIPKTRALAYVMILPISINIFLTEIYIFKQPGLGILLIVLSIIGIYINREKFSSIIS